MIEYWLPREIYFTRDQVFWLLEHLEMLREGFYPPNPCRSGYTEAPLSKKSRSRHAPFETAAMIAAELDSRLKMCGLEGKLLVTEIKADYTMLELSPESKSALNYCSGWRRRRMGYVTWKRSRKHREGGNIHRRMSLLELVNKKGG